VTLAFWCNSIACTALLAGTLASGWLHGRLVNRWGQSSKLETAADRLNPGLPQKLGVWQLVKTLPPEEGVAEALQCAAYLHGVYTNAQTGDTVALALVAGPSGPISVHTPEICFSAQDYEMAGDRQLFSFQDRSGQQHSLWQVHANARDASRPNLRVLYGWSQGRCWEAAAGPRFAFAGLPVLYKLQLAGPPISQHSASAAQSLATQPDACQDFLSHFMAHIQGNLITTSRAALFTR
jgi:hypothetical protein